MAGRKHLFAAAGLTGCLLAGMVVTAMADGLGAGTYEATVDSVGGPLSVSVRVSEDQIEEVTVTENHDTDGVCEAALERIPEQIVENQSINVDTVSGATYSSTGLRNAVILALQKAVK